MEEKKKKEKKKEKKNAVCFERLESTAASNVQQGFGKSTYFYALPQYSIPSIAIQFASSLCGGGETDPLA